jgi:hypothetical protein
MHVISLTHLKTTHDRCFLTETTRSVRRTLHGVCDRTGPARRDARRFDGW